MAKTADKQTGTKITGSPKGSPGQSQYESWAGAVIPDRLARIQSLPAEKYGKRDSALRKELVYLAGVTVGAGRGMYTDAQIDQLLERHKPNWIDKRDLLYQWHRARKQALENTHSITPQYPPDRPLERKFNRVQTAPAETAPIKTAVIEADYDPDFMRRYQIATGHLEPDYADLPAAFWKDDQPVMVAAVSYFEGDYPQEPETQKTCGARWLNTWYEGAKPGTIDVTAGYAHMPVLHGYMTKSGQYIAPCEHCRHDEAVKIARQLERASEYYRTPNLPMRYLETSESEAERLRLRVNQRNQRGGVYNKARIPQENGRAIFIHDADDIEGKPLPVDRHELYDLVLSWVRNRPKGRRGSHGLGTWGKQTVKSENKPQGSGGRDKRKRILRLFGDNYTRYMTYLSAYLGEPIDGRRHDFTVDMSDYIRFLNEVDLDYAVLDGDPDVIDKLYADKSTYVTDDKRPPGGKKRGAKTALGEPVSLAPSFNG